MEETIWKQRFKKTLIDTWIKKEWHIIPIY